MKKIGLLESLRGFSAFYVVISHIFLFKYPTCKLLLFGIDVFPILISYAQVAVMLFFILSGFVIQYSFMKNEDKSFKMYFFKRFTRIYIPLVCVFALSYFIQIFQGELQDFSIRILLANLLMLQDMPWRPGLISTTIFGNYPLWSLSYEWWYYMLFFILTVKFRRFVNSKYIYVIVLLSIVSLPLLSYGFK